MQEDFLHYIWKYKKFDSSDLKGTKGEDIFLLNLGQHNHNAGPDFFNAQIKIDGQLWAGNVEIHLKSSDWYVHNHENDPGYDNVILHVVHEHDTDIYRADNSIIPTLELQSLIDADVYKKYNQLIFSQKKWINCENDFASVDNFILDHWLERLYLERLERKSKSIETMLQDSKNDWEAVLFKLLAKNFGLKVNGDAFLSLASSFDFSVLRKIQSKKKLIHALFYGQAGLLEHNVHNAYFESLRKDYNFLKQKFNLKNQNVLPVQFFRLRPPNFPTIRLSQLAMLYANQPQLFSRIMASTSIEEFYRLFSICADSFWDTHFNFESVSKSKPKTLTNSFVDLLLINTILPLKFTYSKMHGDNQDDTILAIANQIASEKNGIINAFNNLNPISDSAVKSQALIQLKTEYCSKHRCLQCAVGNEIMSIKGSKFRV